MKRIKTFNEAVIRKTMWDEKPENKKIDPNLIDEIQQICMPLLDEGFEFNDDYGYVGGYKLEYGFTLKFEFKRSVCEYYFGEHDEEYTGRLVKDMKLYADKVRAVSENIHEMVDRIYGYKENWDISMPIVKFPDDYIEVSFGLSEKNHEREKQWKKK